MPSEQAKTQKSSKGKGTLLTFFALAADPLVLVLGNSMLVPILPELQSKLQVSRFQSSLVITIFSLTAGLIIPVLGYLSDRFSRKAVMIPSLIIYGAAGVLAGLGAVWHSYTILIIARAIQGIGAAGTSPIVMALVGDMFEGAVETKALGLIEAANGAGKVLSPIIGSALALIVWYAAFFAFPVFCLIALLAVIFLIHEPAKKEQPPKLKQYLGKIYSVLREKGKWLIPAFFAGSLALFILFGVLFYLSDVLEKDPYKIDGVIKGLVLAIPLLGLVTTSYTTGALIKKNGTAIRIVINIGLALMTASLTAAIFLHNNIYIFIGLLTLSAIGTGLVLPCLNTMISGSVQKSERGMISSIYNALRFFGVAFGPPLFGWLMSKSHTALFVPIAILSFLTLGLVFFTIKPKGQIN